MTTPSGPPVPQRNPQTGSPGLRDAATGEVVPMADLRAEFERLSRKVPRDPAAERAFIESKIALIHNDPKLTALEKERATDDLRRGLGK
jgi:hypothetical protein